MRVAALYDIHGMADALAAALDEVAAAEVDALVLGGDVVGGPQPAETMALLDSVSVPVHWIRGNGDRALGDGGADATSAADETLAFTAGRLDAEQRRFLATLPERAVLDVTGLGHVLFCHGTPGSDTELITEETPDRVLRRALDRIEQRVVVSGHTHMQFDRRVDGVRWINAGSVGMPYEGEVAAFWTLLGPDVEFRRTAFDLARAERSIAATEWPEAEEFVAENLRQAIPRAEGIAFFEQLAAERGER